MYQKSGSFKPTLEQLENRTLLSITTKLNSTSIDTPFDSVPRLCGPAVADHHTASDGLWSDPATWLENNVPSTGSKVSVSHNVVYDMAIADELSCIEIGGETNGKLSFALDRNTELHVTTLFVLPQGTLEIISLADSVVSNIVFNDVPLDLNSDPNQYSNGLLVWGTLNINGTDKSPFIRLSQSAPLGATTLELANDPVGWQVGDRIGLPDTQQNTSAPTDETKIWIETAKITNINGRTITLDAPLKFNHMGARNADGVYEIFPHVANLTRSIVLQSENYNGVRGHVITFDRANISIHDAALLDLGRTTSDPLNAVTNHIGRYPLHLHHVYNPVDIVGNVIANADGHATKRVRWGIALHDTHFSTVSQNIVFNAANGAGIVGEDGSEYGNTIDGNFIVGVYGSLRSSDPSQQTGDQGDGIWTQGPFNAINNNVFAGIRRVAIQIASGANNVVTKLVPTAPGQDPSQFVSQRLNWSDASSLNGNEIYSTALGLSLWRIQDDTALDQIIYNTQLWHVWTGGFNVYNGPGRTIIDGWTHLNDPTKIQRLKNNNVGDQNHSIVFSGGQKRFVVINNVRIENCFVGIRNRARAEGELLDVTNATLRNRVNLAMLKFAQVPQVTIIRDSTFGDPFGQTAIDVLMTPGLGNNLLVYSQTLLLNCHSLDSLDYLGGRNYQVYYLEQHPDYIIPQHTTVPSYLVGKTNTEAWTTYQQAWMGGITPCLDQNPRIVGYICEKPQS